MPEDSELIEEILNGSQAAMEVLVRKYYNLIFSYNYRNLGDYHLAKDITQEVFIKMMKNIAKCRDKNKFKSWLLKIAVNTCKDYYKSSSYKRGKEQVEIDVSLTDGEDKVSYIFDKKIEREEIKRHILDLPKEQRETVILRFYHDLKIKDIANATDTNESTVKSRLRMGLKKLKKLIKGGEICEYEQER